MLDKWRTIGLLRQGLHIATIVSATLLPIADGPDYTATWDLVFGGVIPAVVPIFVILIGFDLMMCNIIRESRDEEEVRRLDLIRTYHRWVGGYGLIVFVWFIAPALIP